MEDVTRVEDGRGVVFKRGGFYHARIRVGPNKYVYRTLKTGKKAVAIKAAQRLVHQLFFQPWVVLQLAYVLFRPMWWP